jgi:hypothetical protein
LTAFLILEILTALFWASVSLSVKCGLIRGFPKLCISNTQWLTKCHHWVMCGLGFTNCLLYGLQALSLFSGKRTSYHLQPL